MKQIVQNPGGRWYFGEDFMNPQEEILLAIIEPFLAELGQFVFCGCTLSSNTISPGVVILNGKACKFEGSAEGIVAPYYVRYATKQDNVQYKTGVDVGYITYFAEPCQPIDTGAFRLDNAQRFADIFKPKTTWRADSAATADDAKTLNGKVDAAFATAAQGTKADGAVQTATIGSTPVTKSGTTLQLPAYPTSLPANGGDADTLDGKHAADFVPKNLVFENSGNVDPNATTYPRILALHANCPTRVNDTDYWYIDTTFYSNAEKSQLARPYLDPSKGLYYRAYYENVWTAWQRINDGGNAASLNGKAYTDFVLAATLGGVAVPKSGITLQLPAYPTSLPANGGNADTVGGVSVGNIIALRNVLRDNIDANTLIEMGAYILILGNGTGNTNFPAGVGYGNMIIYGNPTFITQFITTHSDGIMYYRVCYDTSNPAFTPWKKVVTAEAKGDIIAFKTS